MTTYLYFKDLAEMVAFSINQETEYMDYRLRNRVWWLSHNPKFGAFLVRDIFNNWYGYNR